MDNRLNLLDCARTLFASRGYDAVGIQEIVDAAGVTKPTLYYYFTNKHGLLEALLKADFAELQQTLQMAAEYHGDLPLNLQKIVKVFFDFSRAHPEFYRMQLAMNFAPPDSDSYQAVREYSQALHIILEQMFAQASNDHGNMRGRQRMYAATFLGMINTYIGFFLNRYLELDDALLYQAVHQFMHGIYS